MSVSRPIRLAFIIACVTGLTATTGRCEIGQPKPPHDWSQDVDETAVVEHGPLLRTHKDFQLRNVLAQILRTAELDDSNASQEALLETLLATLRRDSAINLSSGLINTLQVRNQDADVTAKGLLDDGENKLFPVALLSRLDLAPGGFTDCGEYRIVFSNAGSDFMLIFEAKIGNGTEENPRPEADCAQLARHWALQKGESETVRLKRLSELYFKGIAGYLPAVHASNYGTGLGQVRSNTFKNSPWMLREWRIAPRQGRIVFEVNPVGDTPLAEFYGDTNGPTASPDGLEASERARFQGQFVANTIRHLIEPDTLIGENPGENAESDVFSRMGAKIEPRSLEFQSDAQGGDDFTRRVGPNFNARIPEIVFQENGRVVERKHILERANAMTCGGCHQTAVGREIAVQNGTSVRWPGTVSSFRHIAAFTDGNGSTRLSPALNDHFLPFRQKVMVSFLNKHQPSRADTRTNSQRSAAVDPAFDLFRQIIRENNKNIADRTLEQYEALIRERQERDAMRNGFFVKYRRPH